DEGRDGRRGAQLAPPRLRIIAEHGMREHGARVAPRLLERDDVGGADLELALAAVIVGVALVVGLPARGAHLEHQPALAQIEEIDLPAARPATGGPDDSGRQLNLGHGTHATGCPSAIAGRKPRTGYTAAATLFPGAIASPPPAMGCDRRAKITSAWSALSMTRLICIGPKLPFSAL